MEYVGLPELASVGKQPALLEWQVFPSMQPIRNSCRRWGARYTDKDTPLLFLCRSGVRSVAAAKAMSAAGYSTCINVSDGFEGSLDANGKRGSGGGVEGDRASIWRQS